FFWETRMSARWFSMAVIFLLLQIASGQEPGANLAGITQDCFGQKQIHPAGVNIYLVDPHQSPEIVAIFEKMRQQSKSKDKIEEYFASYRKLAETVRATKRLKHVVSDNSGRFTFSGLQAGKRILILGLAEREDEPAYHASKVLESLHSGETTIVLDFDPEETCERN